MRIIDLLKISAFVFFLTSCATAPIAVLHTAAPLGEDNNSIETGLSPLPYIQYALGASEDVDIGIGFEHQIIGESLYGFTKYSIINAKDNGWSFAISGGGGLGIAESPSMFLYAGPIASWRDGGFEFFVTPRLNFLSLGLRKNFVYEQIASGVQYHFNHAFALGLSGSFSSHWYMDGTPVTPAINLIFNF